jgi:alkylation response protein AidB-like acyl-CoA dehydrogenase
MDIELSSEQRMLQETSRRFLAEANFTNSIRDRAGSGAPFDASYWTRAANLGWTSMLIPDAESVDGISESIIELAIVAEESGRALQPGPLLHCNIVANALYRQGSTESRSALLPGLLDGSLTASWAVAEDPDWWELSNVAMSAVLDGSEYLLNGVKTSVEAADTSDVFLVTCVAEDGPAQFVVPRNAEGLIIKMLPTLDLSRSFGELTFDGVRANIHDRVGDSKSTRGLVESQFLLALVVQCAEMVGLIDKVFNWTLEYMQDRYAFGRPIGSYQSLKHRVADHKVWLEAALGLSSAVARACAQGDPAALELAYAAKAHIADLAMKLLSDCAQIFGGISMTWEHDFHLYLRRATVDRALFGSPEQMRERLCVLVGL